MHAKSTTIRIDYSTKHKIENLDFVRKHTFDQILLKLIELYEKNKKHSKLVTKNLGKTKSTTIRITKSTRDKLENLDFVRKHTFDQILLILIKIYEKNKTRYKK